MSKKPFTITTNAPTVGATADPFGTVAELEKKLAEANARAERAENKLSQYKKPGKAVNKYWLNSDGTLRDKVHTSLYLTFENWKFLQELGKDDPDGLQVAYNRLLDKVRAEYEAEKAQQ